MFSRDGLLLRVWLGLECIEIRDDRLFRIDGNTCDDIEQILIVRYSSGTFEVYFRNDIPQEAIDHLTRLASPELLFFSNLDGALYPYPILERRAEITYTYDQDLIEAARLSDVEFRGDGKSYSDEFAICQDGRVASRAWSVRRNRIAAEIAVETHGDYRQRGYGKKVTLAWVDHQQSQGKIPIYSHRSGNLESKALARSTGARKFVEVVSYQ